MKWLMIEIKKMGIKKLSFLCTTYIILTDFPWTFMLISSLNGLLMNLINKSGVFLHLLFTLSKIIGNFIQKKSKKEKLTKDQKERINQWK